MNWRKLRHVLGAWGTGIPIGVVLALAVNTVFPTWIAVALGLMSGLGYIEERFREDK